MVGHTYKLNYFYTNENQLKLIYITYIMKYNRFCVKPNDLR